jgi:hypothetical protein
MKPAERQTKPEPFTGLTLVGSFPSRQTCQEYVSERGFDDECMVQNATMLFEIKLAVEFEDLPPNGRYLGLRRGEKANEETRRRNRLALVLRTVIEAGAHGTCQMQLWYPGQKHTILDRFCLEAIAAGKDPGDRHPRARLLLTILRLLEDGEDMHGEPWMDTSTARQLLEA